MYMWTAFILGLLGSLHCLGMCGPLAIALPPSGRTLPAYVTGRLLYNLGRVITYGLLGAIFGLVGKTLVLAGAQRWVSIGIGIAILLAVLLAPKYGARLRMFNPAYRLVGALKTALGGLLKRHSVGALLGIGILNGFLPCGLVYVALAGAAATGSAASGFLYMVFFGLGTYPLMLGVSLTGKALQVRLKLNVKRAIPIALVMLAVLFILRGLSLGIPYVSPRLEPGAPPGCCH